MVPGRVASAGPKRSLICFGSKPANEHGRAISIQAVCARGRSVTCRAAASLAGGRGRSLLGELQARGSWAPWPELMAPGCGHRMTDADRSYRSPRPPNQRGPTSSHAQPGHGDDARYGRKPSLCLDGDGPGYARSADRSYDPMTDYRLRRAGDQRSRLRDASSHLASRGATEPGHDQGVAVARSPPVSVGMVARPRPPRRI